MHFFYVAKKELGSLKKIIRGHIESLHRIPAIA